ncbi:MAG: histidine--tRNA ligase family protein [Chloroflexi bacterium]|nr:histidine--tRNA ligase family protein [Chloroflexota bacterium]
MRVARPSGLSDRLPDEARALQACQRTLQRTLTSFGYGLVDTPALEYVELFLAKAGQRPGLRLFTLEQGRRRLCLRPEFTVSVARLFVEKMQGWPRPIRLQYAGPVFRLETPQRGRSRQFTMMGGEMLGGDGPSADAEAIALACVALSRAGVQGYRVSLGHVGIVQELLGRMDLSQRGQQFVLRHLESLRKPHHGRSHVEKLLGSLYGEGAAEAAASAALQGANGAATDTVTALLTAQGGFLGTRSAEEIAERLTAKRQTRRDLQRIRRALDAVEELHRLTGPVQEALPAARAYLAAQGWHSDGLAELEACVALAQAYDLPAEALWLDLGMGRGLHYYTGIVFEIHSLDELEPDAQLCGGGRYDHLLSELGSAQAVPAVGFAIGLERVLDCLPRPAEPPEAQPPADLLVAPVEASDAPYAIAVAQRLRAAGWQAELQVKEGVGLGQSLRLADRRGIPWVVIAGGDERARQAVLLRHLPSRTQQSVSLACLEEALAAASPSGERSEGYGQP